jgi:ABC-type multidrug transport system fused ATPase/permease subunit
VMRGRTTIVITHRPELARRADRVLTLSGARIVEPVF